MLSIIRNVICAAITSVFWSQLSLIINFKTTSSSFDPQNMSSNVENFQLGGIVLECESEITIDYQIQVSRGSNVLMASIEFWQFLWGFLTVPEVQGRAASEETPTPTTVTSVYLFYTLNQGVLIKKNLTNTNTTPLICRRQDGCWEKAISHSRNIKWVSHKQNYPETQKPNSVTFPSRKDTFTLSVLTIAHAVFPWLKSHCLLGSYGNRRFTRCQTAFPEWLWWEGPFLFFLFCIHFCYFSNCSPWTPGTVRHLAELILFTLQFEKTLTPYNSSAVILFFIATWFGNCLTLATPTDW